MKYKAKLYVLVTTLLLNEIINAATLPSWDEGNEAIKNNWNIVSMKNDWKIIFPFEDETDTTKGL